MVTVVKHEWHQVDRQFCLEVDESLLEEIYPDLGPGEIEQMLKNIEEGLVDVEDIINDAWENDVDLEWDHQYDDCWTDRKGGYDVTYELGDEDSYHHEPPPPEPTHKCTKCKWTGQGYDADWKYDEINEDGEAKKVCPYCESDVELTEVGIQEEKERKERWAKWDAETDEESNEEAEEEPYCECDTLDGCGWKGPETDAITIEGVMCCPECREPVTLYEQILEQRAADLDQSLQELKDEFDRLLEESPVVKMKCIDCEWEGDWSETGTATVDGTEVDCCPDCGGIVEEVEDESK